MGNTFEASLMLHWQIEIRNHYLKHQLDALDVIVKDAR
jgi:hypothetical protein